MLLLKYHRRIVESAQHWKDRLLDCNDGECNGPSRAWRRLSNGGGSIHLDGSRYCFPECFERRLRQRFQEMQADEIPKPRAPHRVPLGLMMLSRGHVTNAQLRRALDAQQQNGSGKIGEWIQKLGYAPELQVTGALAVQWSCPVIKSLPLNTHSNGVPVALLKMFRMVPVQFVAARRKFHFAFCGNIEYQALLAIERILCCQTEACLTTSAEVESALERIEQRGELREKTFAGPCTPEELARITSSYARRLNARSVRTTSCVNLAWVRVESHSAGDIDLLFRAAPDEPSRAHRTEIHLAG